MEAWKSFLLQHAKFPYPLTEENHSVNTTSTSALEAGRLDLRWKAKVAIHDANLIQNLCNTLDTIVGDKSLPDAACQRLQGYFSPELDGDPEWGSNPDEAQAKQLLMMGFFPAARRCLSVYDGYGVRTVPEDSVLGARARVDYVVKVNNIARVLVEAKSPSVMARLDQLPANGMILTWDDSGGLTRKIFTKVALYLAQHRLEWLFLTSHNHWMVCRLVTHDTEPFLAYSTRISMENSSVPFRAFLGAILSAIEGHPVTPSTRNPDLVLDSIAEEDEGEDNDRGNEGDDSGSYHGDPPMRSTPPETRASHGRGRGRGHIHPRNESELMITSSDPSLPEPTQTWVYLQPWPNNTFALPQHARDSERRGQLTRIIGSGSTGDVWECHFNGDTKSYALKVVEVLRISDADRQERLHHEFGIYQTLEDAYVSGQLHNRIAPRCYGAFHGHHMDVLILELCNGRLKAWDELGASERTEVHKLVEDLHSVGVVHQDLEPRNIVRVEGGGFRLIDFSESRKHTCREKMVSELHGRGQIRNRKCSELQALRDRLWPTPGQRIMY